MSHFCPLQRPECEFSAEDQLCRPAGQHCDLTRLQVVIRGVAARLPQRALGPRFAGSPSSGRASHTFTVPSRLAEASRWPSHTFTVPSQLAEASRWPSGLNATLQPAPARVRVSCPVIASHIFTV